MADNYLEKRHESYEEKKKKWEKKRSLEQLKHRIQKMKECGGKKDETSRA